MDRTIHKYNRGMGRPVEFEQDVVLRRAMEVFWCHGYEGAGTPLLLEAMGIGRQSFYNTFESKRALFLKALELYQEERLVALKQTLSSAETPARGVEAVLTSIANATGLSRTLGCLAVNTAAEMGASDAEVAEVLKRGLRRSRVDLIGAVELAKERGEFSEHLDAKVAANYVLSTMRGLRISAREGLSTEELRGIVRMTMAALLNSAD